MLKFAFLALAALAGVFGIVVAMQPPTYRVTRSATIAAPPERVFALVHDYRKWDGWSPWAKLDPNMKSDYSGPPAGAGASYHWVGNSDVGEGRMTTLESRPTQYMKIKLEFLKPFESNSITEFTIKPEGAGTAVVWDMAGDADLMTKAMSLFTSMDSMIGPDFEKGLKQMKTIAESTQP